MKISEVLVKLLKISTEEADILAKNMSIEEQRFYFGRAIEEGLYEASRGPPADVFELMRRMGIEVRESYLSADYQKWKQVFKEVRREFGIRGVKEIKKIRYDIRRDAMIKQIEDPAILYGPEIGEWILDELFKLKGDENCVDNWRWAEVGNRPQVRRYNRAKRKGCCGCIDVKVSHPRTNKVFLIGLNYGH